MNSFARFGAVNVAPSFSQYITNMTAHLPKIVRKDIDFKVSARMRRAGATERGLALFAGDVKRNAERHTNYIIDKYPFARVSNDSMPDLGLNHDILVSDERCKAFAEYLTGEFDRIINAIEPEEEQEGEPCGAAYLNTLWGAYSQIAEWLLSNSIQPPVMQLKQETIEERIYVLEGAVKRCFDATYLIRKLKRLRKQYIEYSQMVVGNVGKKKHQHIYVSSYSFAMFKRQMREAQEFLESMSVVNTETFTEFCLKDVAERTTANPANRRVELIVRTRGDEERAIDMGFDGVFLTWTLASKYHRASRKWNGCTVKEAHKNLMEQWKLARAHFKKNEIKWFGLRVAEPHKDGTPHAHMFLYVKPEHKEALISICQQIATFEDKSELYNKQGQLDISPRFKAKLCDPTKGGATAYIIKYISKNINGAYMPENDADDIALSVRAWASIWGIKQFSQSGSPTVGLWRQLRRASEFDVAFDEELAELQNHADNSRWKGFCELAGKAKLAYEEKLNKYDETTKKVIGFQWLEKVIETCAESYALVQKSKVEAFKKERSDAPWSTENKCNQVPKVDISSLEKALMDVTGWSVKGIQCLISPLKKGAQVPIDKYTTIALRNNRLMVV